jgi:hypothetical protein
VTLEGKQVMRRTAAAVGAGVVKLKVTAKGGALKALRRVGKAKVDVKVGFRTTEGGTASVARAIALKLRGSRTGHRPAPAPPRRSAVTE